MVLNAGVLEYYESYDEEKKEGVNKKGEMSLRGADLPGQSDDAEDAEDAEDTEDTKIYIIGPEGVNDMHIEAPDETTARTWAKAIRKHIEWCELSENAPNAIDSIVELGVTDSIESFDTSNRPQANDGPEDFLTKVTKGKEKGTDRFGSNAKSGNENDYEKNRTSLLPSPSPAFPVMEMEQKHERHHTIHTHKVLKVPDEKKSSETDYALLQRVLNTNVPASSSSRKSISHNISEIHTPPSLRDTIQAIEGGTPVVIHGFISFPQNFSRMVMPAEVVASDGISCKLMPSRKSANAPFSKHGMGTQVNVWLRRLVKDKLKESYWLLTNLGWVAERSIGTSRTKTSLSIVSVSDPVNIKCTGARFLQPPGRASLFEKLPDFVTMIDLEFEYACTSGVGSITDQPEDLNQACRACFEVLGTKYVERPIVRITRPYQMFIDLHENCDMADRALGAEFPGNYVDGVAETLDEIEALYELVDKLGKWIAKVVEHYKIKEFDFLEEFLTPTDEDIARMNAALTSFGGLNDSWSDVAAYLRKGSEDTPDNQIKGV